MNGHNYCDVINVEEWLDLLLDWLMKESNNKQNINLTGSHYPTENKKIHLFLFILRFTLYSGS